MLKLNDLGISEAARAHLAARQADVDSKPSFREKVDRAQQLWASKTKTEGQGAFLEIKRQLRAMSVAEGSCNYCERSEGSDIEHIAPKSFFPERAFLWSNYLLACGVCNSHFKRDVMHVFLDLATAETARLTPKVEPSSQDLAFIDPRAEDPMDLMLLDLETFQFEVNPAQAEGTRGFKKVFHTVDALALNDRSLAHHRRNALRFYKGLLAEYVRAKPASTFRELEAAIHGNPQLDESKSFDHEHQRVLSGIRAAIHSTPHPTVWQEMIHQREQLGARIQNLLAQAPELIEASRSA